MRKELSNRLIGLFVVVAFGLLFAFVVTYGIGKYFREERHFVMYFEGSLNGLQVGAPVKYSGVQVGEVEDLHIEFNHDTDVLSLPVTINIQPHRVVDVGSPRKSNNGSAMQDLIKKGLRARLKSSSLLTGSLYVELETIPDSPVRLTGKNKKLMEIPTISSKSENIADMIDSAKSTLKTIEDFVNSKDIENGIKDFGAMMRAGKDTMIEARTTMKNAHGAIDDTQAFMQDGRKLVSDSRRFFNNGTTLVKNVNSHVSPMAVKITDAAHEMSDTLTAIRVLADYLARHPEALLSGKSASNQR